MLLEGNIEINGSYENVVNWMPDWLAHFQTYHYKPNLQKI